MLKEQLDKTVLTKLKLPHKVEPDLETWKDFLGRLKNPTSDVCIGLVGKYVELPDAYKSIIESFIHAGAKNECKVKVRYIPSEEISAKPKPSHSASSKPKAIISSPLTRTFRTNPPKSPNF